MGVQWQKCSAWRVKSGEINGSHDMATGNTKKRESEIGQPKRPEAEATRKKNRRSDKSAQTGENMQKWAEQV